MKVVDGKRKQRGITLIGFIVVLVVAGFFAYMGMVLGPAYTEYYGVVKAMNFVAGEATPNSTDFDTMRRSLDKQFNVGYVESVTGKDAKLVREKTGNSLSIEYEVRKSFIYNIDFIVKFSHSVPLGSKTAGD
jgi:Tfp pilus assembly protein PilE